MLTMALTREMVRGLDELAQRQDDVVSRRQLVGISVGHDRIRSEVRARRWRLIGRQAVVLHRGPLTERQSWWVAVLTAGKGAALAGLTAAASYGLVGFPSDAVHVVVANGTRIRRVRRTKVHVSRRFVPADLHPALLPPRTNRERSLVDAAVWSENARTACAILVSAVQQRLTTAGRLRRELQAAGGVRHRAVLLAIMDDVEGGSHALTEIDLVRLCRRLRLPLPIRQSVRTDRFGRRRYLDAEWRLPDGRVVVVEVDGGIHLLPLNYWDDMDRDVELVISGRTVVRIPSVAFRLDERRVGDQLTRVLLGRESRRAA